jgi:hypothetical protein
MTLGPGIGIEDPGGPVLAAGRHQMAIRAEGHRSDRAVVVKEPERTRNSGQRAAKRQVTLDSRISQQ